MSAQTSLFPATYFSSFWVNTWCSQANWRYNLSSGSWVLSPASETCLRHLYKKMTRGHPCKCPSHLNCLISIQSTGDSTPMLSWSVKLLTLSQRVSTESLRRNLISGSFTHNHILLVTTHSSWPGDIDWLVKKKLHPQTEILLHHHRPVMWL